ncbi:ubiquilin-2 [Drosophila bipectinata]|uniref:ubiquilin-2 n=1 Tax=Drosophila bipectinata TaxID=42026 RepID=UPI001C89C542|nr:ubiquilin-2 [Drosophila bipectinata]
MSGQESIDIVAKGNGLEAIVSLRQNELIRNLRALVAVRFEQAIPRIVLVFAGEVLRDVGTIDDQGIISGVTVHVVCRPEKSQGGAGQVPPPEPCCKSKSSNFLTRLANQPNLMRTVLQSDPRIQSMLDENATLRHYLNSDRNLLELASHAFSPAKAEMSRRRDLHIKRLQSMSGGQKLLLAFEECMRQNNENTVARTYKHPPLRLDDGTNPQRGLENRCPLPNPWRRTVTLEDLNFAKLLETALRRKCRKVMKTLAEGDAEKSVAAVRGLHEAAALARRSFERRIRENQIKAANSPGGAEAIGVGTVVNISSGLRMNVSYKGQMERLQQLGYNNEKRNQYALQVSLGNLEGAVRLLDHWNRTQE